MPSVLATSILVDHIDVHDLPTEPPRACRAQKGFWRTLAQYVAWLRVWRTHVGNISVLSHTSLRRQQSCLHGSTLRAISRPSPKEY